VAKLKESAQIQGVILAELEAFGDQRGRFAETFRKEWFPQRSWERMQANRSESQAGVLRGLHYHHHQVDYWHCVSGRIRVGLCDLRPASPTRGQSQLLDLGQDPLQGLYIPCGVAHGFAALSVVTLFYVVDNYYDGADELGVAWNDPQLGLEWKLEAPPILSARDQRNPLLAEIPAGHLPR
jgi:dTDP-4-dehydrorhamnose 3,5-epimerase